MQTIADKYVTYRGPSGPPSIPGVYEVTTHRLFRKNKSWGDAVITGIAANSDGSATLTFTSLAGVTISSCGGGTPVINGDVIEFPVGSYWDLYLSNGAYIPDITSGYNVTAFGTHGTPNNFSVDITSGGSVYCLINGYNLSGNTMIPASKTDTLVDVLGNPVQYTGVFNRHNLATGLIDYSDIPEPIFNKNAYVGNTFGLPEVWINNVWDYSDGNPYHWLPEERTMSYLTSRLTSAYKNTIMIKEIIVSGTLVGISREEIFDPAISDKDYNTLNFIYNGVPLPI